MYFFKSTLKITVFLAMLLLWNFVTFLIMIWLTQWFRQYYFLQDINEFLNSPLKHIQINFCIFTWILLIYGFIFSVIISYLYARDSVNVAPSSFSIESGRNIVLSVKIISLFLFLILIVTFKRIPFLKSIYSFFGDISSWMKTALIVTPLSMLIDEIAEKPLLVIHMLTPSVYKKFLKNRFALNSKLSLSFWAQNVGKKKNKFKFLGVCRLSNYEAIKNKKLGTYKLLKNPVLDSQWKKLDSQDTMPIVSIENDWLRRFLGLFNETICLVYKSTDDKFYRENLNIDTYNKAKVYSSGSTRLDYLGLICTVIQIIITYPLDIFLNSPFFYTLSFILFLYVLMKFSIQFILKTSISKIKIAYEYNEINNSVRIQIKNDLNKKWEGSLKIYNNKELICQTENIKIDKTALSRILCFSGTELRLNDEYIRKWKVVLEGNNCKDYTFYINTDIHSKYY